MAGQSSDTGTANTNALLAKTLNPGPEMSYCAPRASAEDLPTEILLIILKLVFMKSRVGTHRACSVCQGPRPRTFKPCTCPDKPFETIWDQKEDRQNPHIFPYATSHVCSQWRNVMKTVPIFWTRIIIFVDTNPTPLARLVEHLELSDGLPLDLYVLRKSDTYDQPDPEEHTRCAAVIEILRSYFQHCRVISFDVIHNSSLPSITREMYGCAHHLVKLELKCRLDDGQEFVSRPFRRGSNIKPFTSPILENLHVDGRNFADACVDLPSWCESLTRLQELTISNFRPVLNGVEHLCSVHNVAEALSNFHNLYTLSFVNVEFPEDDFEDPNEPLFITASNLCLTDIPKEFLIAFSQRTEVSPFTLYVLRSPLPYVGRVFDAVEVSLEGIPQHEDMAAFLRLWRGVVLQVDRCEGFDDRAVQALGDEHLAIAADLLHECRNLDIIDCPNVSPGALKELIKRRYDMNTFGQAEGERCTLSVTGKGAVLSADDRTWFEENLDHLFWNTQQAS